MVIAGLFLLGLRGFLNYVLVDPAVRLFWLLDSLPQAVIWVVLTVGLGFLSLRLLLFPREGPAQDHRVRKRLGKSALVELVQTIKNTRALPWYRRALEHRLARLAVTIRLERELIPAQKAWDELRSGSWPHSPALKDLLRGETKGDFLSALSQALEELERYAKGGGS